jgi:hypothetical protein
VYRNTHKKELLFFSDKFDKVPALLRHNVDLSLNISSVIASPIFFMRRRFLSSTQKGDYGDIQYFIKYPSFFSKDNAMDFLMKDDRSEKTYEGIIIGFTIILVGIGLMLAS